jgi:hypothetical protein
LRAPATDKLSVCIRRANIQVVMMQQAARIAQAATAAVGQTAPPSMQDRVCSARKTLRRSSSWGQGLRAMLPLRGAGRTIAPKLQCLRGARGHKQCGSSATIHSTFQTAALGSAVTATSKRLTPKRSRTFVGHVARQCVTSASIAVIAQPPPMDCACHAPTLRFQQTQVRCRPALRICPA